MGRLIIKSDINIEVLEVKASEYDKIIKNIPNMTEKDIDKMVRIRANEIIKFILQDETDNLIFELNRIEKSSSE